MYQVSSIVLRSTQSPCLPRYSYSMWQEYTRQHRLFHLEGLPVLRGTPDVEAVHVVNHRAFAQTDKALGVRERIDGDGTLEEVCTRLDLCPDLRPFPFIPVRHVVKLRFTADGRQLAVDAERPGLAAGAAAKRAAPRRTSCTRSGSADIGRAPCEAPPHGGGTSS